jgi:2-keto-4-pentenoate hydratase/2-oxohepta-3-ene-1,7-dioic acid hydratase in catechol pathway
MKLITFAVGGQERIGALLAEEQLVDFSQADSSLPQEMVAFLKGGDAARERAAQIMANPPQEAILPLSKVKLCAPIPKPGKILCIGLNYRDHAEESNQPVPDYPTVFSKYDNVIIGPGDPIVLPAISDQVDYEAEFAFVMGRRARHVSAADALDYVAGYMPFNDISARDFQMRTSQWTIGKSFDTFGPIGPSLVTADEVADPHALDIRLLLNGQVMQSSNTRNLIFNVNQLIAYITAAITLEPGDVITTGTPAGVGAARKPQVFLQPGDVVRLEIEGLGALENPVVAEHI